jgi:hypothetical protein
LIEHPSPTAATAKLLYAHAFRCARPGCPELLYREDELSGTWTLNSRICHISARSEGGPRWDPEQKAQDNRADGNLLLMCSAHASAIDDPKAVSAYPTPLLLQWKAAQIEDHRQMGKGWPLTNAMATNAITASFSNVAVAINNSTLKLGGEGGRSIGAAGGGGGAIGPDARAGDGGDGGRITDLEGNPLSGETLEQFLTDIPMEPPPGAGGGGAGAVGPGAIGGDGGNGGDGLQATLDIEPGDIVEVVVGESGKSSRLPGQHSTAGGDSVMTVKSADGKIKRIVRAKGGAGSMSGKLPDDWFPASQADVEGGLQISTLLVANSVELRDGLLFVLGGGWSKFTLPTLPIDAIWNIVCAANWTKLSAGHTRGFHLCLSDPGGKEVSRLALELPAIATHETTWTWLRNLDVPLDREGVWQISVKSGEFILAELNIAVTVSQIPPPTAGI